MKKISYLFTFLIIMALSPVPVAAVGHCAPGCELQKPRHPPVPGKLKKAKKVKEPKEPKKPKTPKEPKKPKTPPKPPWMK